MTTSPPSKRFLIVAGGVAAFYAIYAFFLRKAVEGTMDHLKILLFALVIGGWMLLCFSFGPRLRKRRVGIRVAILLFGILLIVVFKESFRHWLRADPVWWGLLRGSLVVFWLPLATIMFSRGKNESLE